MTTAEDPITEEHKAFLLRQPMFFVATAAAGARVNLSPKGLDALRVLDGRHVAYLDLTGSGAETAAHLRVDGRITLMVCGFDDPARILRLYGRGEVLARGGDEFAALAPSFGALADSPGARAIVRIAVDLAKTSCGFGVPVMTLAAPRPVLTDWADKSGEEGMLSFQRKHNRFSIDGLPTGLPPENAT